MDDVLIPKTFLGLTPGPDLANYQYLVTLSVELEDGTILRVAFPLIYLDMYRDERLDASHGPS
jgi:hypothetical protein